MHNAKPRPQLLHHDVQGCTFCTELIGGLVVMPCTAILRIWTRFPALLFGLHCQFAPVGIFTWKGGNCSTGKPDTSFCFGHHQSQHFQTFSLATFLRNCLKLFTVLGSDHIRELRNHLWLKRNFKDACVMIF